MYILHVKYRFIESLSQQTGEKRIPAPFATMLDPVLKIDQRRFPNCRRKTSTDRRSPV